MKWEYPDGGEEFDFKDKGLFIVCEGNFQYGNATLSYYSPQDDVTENEVFLRANGMKLGDVAQSMTMHDGKGWIVVNNSRVIFAINPDTFKEEGRIENLTAPRYIHFVSDTKAYVSQLWDNRIAVLDPSAYKITGYIRVPGMTAESGSTEQMVQVGKYVYCTCWSYQNRIIKIDTETDEVADDLIVGIQPRWITVDSEGYLWTLSDGGYEGSPYGYEAPALCRIDPATLTVVRRLDFRKGDTVSSLVTDGMRSTLYWINRGVWRMDIDAGRLPGAPFLAEEGTRYYDLTVDPAGGDIYVADAIDYQQKGIVYRFDASGSLISEINVGVTPGAFCWK